jgi:hypothetical protein
MRPRSGVAFSSLALFLPLALACADRPGSVPEVPESELAADVPELDALHELMMPLWHDAFPARDFDAIRDAVPQFQEGLSALGAAALPGILQDKQEAWEAGIERLFQTYQALRGAADAGDEDEILANTEAFHMNYEGLVRIIRPVVPELEVFHQHLYGVYHYYGPGYDLEKIQAAAGAMAESVPPLQAAQLPERLAEHQDRFGAAVSALGQEVALLLAALQDPDRDQVDTAIESVHTAYEAVEAIFE